MNTAIRIEDLPHYTYNDYKLWPGQWELIQGIPFAMSPAPRYKHQFVITKLLVALDRALENCSKCQAIGAPIDWKISNDTVLQPDVMINCGVIGDVVYIEKPPEFIAEVLSPHNREKDLLTKFNLYKNEKVKYYLVIDADKKQVTIFEYRDGAYEQIKELSEESCDFQINKCDFSVDFSRIWANF